MIVVEEMIPLSKARTNLRAHFGDVSDQAISKWVVRGKLTDENERVRLQAEKIGSQWFTRDSWVEAFKSRFPSVNDLGISDRDEQEMSTREQALRSDSAMLNRIEEEDWQTISRMRGHTDASH